MLSLPTSARVLHCDADMQFFDKVNHYSALDYTAWYLDVGAGLSSPTRAVHVARQGPERYACGAGHSRDEWHVAGRSHSAAALAAERELLVRSCLLCCTGHSLCPTAEKGLSHFCHHVYSVGGRPWHAVAKSALACMTFGFPAVLREGLSCATGAFASAVV